MYNNNVGKIEAFLQERIGETKGLSEWRYEVNQISPRKRRLTNKELAYIFNRVLKNKFNIEHRPGSIEYTFFHPTS